MTLISREFAILFADVTGSTRLYEEMGDKPAAKAIERVLVEMQAVVAQWGGRVVKTIGDEVMAAFTKAGAAAEAARSMQERVDAMLPVAGHKFAIRVGFHFGPVLEDKDDFWGDGVNTAARIAGLAKARQILTSAATAAALPPQFQPLMRDLDAQAVKGKQDGVHVFEMLWQADEETTQMVHTPTQLHRSRPIVLSLGGRPVVFPMEKGSVSLGRDAGSDIHVTEKSASRQHARIELRGAQYFLVDVSSNGTYVTLDGDQEVLVRREQIMLRVGGKAAFGVAASLATEVLTFSFG